MIMHKNLLHSQAPVLYFVQGRDLQVLLLLGLEQFWNKACRQFQISFSQKAVVVYNYVKNSWLYSKIVKMSNSGRKLVWGRILLLPNIFQIKFKIWELIETQLWSFWKVPAPTLSKKWPPKEDVIKGWLLWGGCTAFCRAAHREIAFFRQ